VKDYTSIKLSNVTLKKLMTLATPRLDHIDHLYSVQAVALLLVMEKEILKLEDRIAALEADTLGNEP